jgi:hypothetical protein
MSTLPNIEKPKKKSKSTYIIKDLEKENNLNEKIRISFDDPNEYLNIQPNMIIGKYKL